MADTLDEQERAIMDDMQRTHSWNGKRYVPKSGAGSSSSTTTTNNNNNEIVCIDVSPPSKAAPPRVSTSPDDLVEIVEESWYEKLQKTDSYKIKFEILKGTAYGSPKQAAMQEFLADFMNEKGKTFFSSKESANRYDEVAGQLKATYSKTKSALTRDWSAKFCAEKLAILLCLEEQEMKKKTAATASSATAATRRKKKKTPQVNALKRNYAKLTAVYKKCYKSYTERKKVEAGKKARTLSLDLQKTGTRIQDSHTFIQGNALPAPCPHCGHCNTMAVGKMTPEAAAAENERLRLASADDGKFKAISYQVACFCCKTPCTGEDGDDGLTTDCELCLAEMAQDTLLALEDTECKCQCQATFMEVDRRKIVLAVAKNKSRGEKKKSGADVKLPPQGTTSSLYYQRMFETIDNNTIREKQHNDGRTMAQVMQDAASHAALDMFSAGVSPGTRRALASEIPLKSNLKFRHPDGSKESMTLAKAKKSMKNPAKADSLQAKQGSNTSFVPSHNTFEANRDTSYSVETVMDPHRRNRNSLSRVPLSVPHHPSAPSAFPQVTHPGYNGGVGFGALMNDAASAASASTGGAAAASIPHMAALGDAASTASASSSTNSAPPKSMNDRVRGRATRAAFTSSTSPRSKRHAKKIRQGLTGGDADFTTMAEDLPEMNSQEIYGLMVEMVETPTKAPEEELS